MAPNTHRQPVGHRSYSQLRSFRKCGEQYRLERIEGAPSRPSWAMVAGIVIHVGTELVDRTLLASPDEPLSALVEAGSRESLAAIEPHKAKHSDAGFPPDEWKVYGGRGTAPRQDEYWWRNVGLPASIRAYTEWRLGTKWPIYNLPGFGPAIEIPFELGLPGVMVKGVMDRLFEVDGQIVGVDLKSGLEPENDEQLGLYAAVLRRAGLKSDYGYYLSKLKTGKAKLSPPLSMGHWSDEKLTQVYGRTDKAINAGLFVAQPGEACFHCGVSGSCEFYQSVV